MFSERFGDYVCDVEKMLGAIQKTRNDMYAETGRWPCYVFLHPADVHALRGSVYFEPDKAFITAGRVFTVKVVIQEGLKGVARLHTCVNCRDQREPCMAGE